MSDREDLAALLRERSVRRGDFVLASGARSSFYVDARRTTMTGRGQLLLGRLCLQLIREQKWQPRSVGGLTLGADPVAYAIAHAAALDGATLDAFTVRKEPKGHGTGRQIEGAFDEGSSVVVVEDSMTTGESALRAIAVLEAAGASVVGILTVVDREEGGREKLAAAGYSLASLFTARELLQDPASV